jgi:O-antigen/teichoic acid export membrane protein
MTTEAKAPTAKATVVARADAVLGWGRSMFGATARKGLVSLADQSIVSGTRFLMTILLGRLCGADELGIYALGFSILMIIHCIQQSLISGPYTVFGQRYRGPSRVAYAGSALVHSGLLAAVAALCLGVVGILVSLISAEQSLPPLFWILAATAPLILFREFARQFAFAHLAMKMALLLDVMVAAGQVCGIALLAVNGLMSAFTAYCATGLACGLACLAWYVRNRESFTIQPSRITSDFKQNWMLGKWDLASETAATFQHYGLYWLLALLAGNAATGVFAACMTVMLLANPFVLGLGNVFTPRAAQTFAQDGPSGLRRIIWKTTLVLGGALALFCGVAILFGDDILMLMYGDGEFAGQGEIVTVLAISSYAAILAYGPEMALWVMQRPDINFRNSLLGLLVTLTSTFLLLPRCGVLGAAYALLAGRTVVLLATLLAYRQTIRAVSTLPENVPQAPSSPRC